MLYQDCDISITFPDYSLLIVIPRNTCCRSDVKRIYSLIRDTRISTNRYMVRTRP